MEMTAIDMEVRTLRHERVSKDSQRLISQWPHGDDSHRHGGTLSDMNGLSKDSQRLIHSDHMEMTAIDMEVRVSDMNWES